jgi:Ca2+-transporting ATPase
LIRPIHTTVRGRARFRIEGLYRAEQFKIHLETSLSQCTEIHRVSASILTSNILILYHPDKSPQAIASILSDVVSRYHEGSREERYAGNNEKAADRSSAGTLVASLKKVMQWAKKPAASRFPLLVSDEHDDPFWHTKSAEEVLNSFGTAKESGLSHTRVSELLLTYGANRLPESVSRSGFLMFIDQFKSLPVLLLGVAAGLAAFTGGALDALVIASVVGINAVIGYITEREATRAISSLKSLVKPRAHVIREGHPREIEAEKLVPGDILVLRPGMYVPADCRLVESHNLSVDESALTGESMPVMKTSAPLSRPDVPLGDRLNMVYMGTLIIGGQGLAVVAATGRFTEIGRVQTLIDEATQPETPMERDLRKIGNQLVLVTGGICGLVLAIGLLRGAGFIQMLKASLSLAVAAVPEGLPTVATTTLALGIRSMRRNRVLIRQLDAVATLGSVQTICFDKTGTITHNIMAVVRVHAGMKEIRVEEGTFVTAEGPIDPAANPDLRKLLEIAVLCNETEVSRQEDRVMLNGSSTENALVRSAMDSGIDIQTLRREYPRVQIVHRSENRNFMSTVHSVALPNPGVLVALKGNPLEVLNMCSWQVKDGACIPLAEEDRSAIEAANERMASDALRVLGVAYAFYEEDELGLTEYNNCTWLGLVGMADPIREGVRELIRTFHQAGLDTVMITGDQSATAYAVGKELGLSRDEPLEILDSVDLTDVQPEVMEALSKRVHVFARVSPAHKLQIVQALQRAGRVVAMTGDGVNDGPALKAADIGIAMGGSGTDIAREIADIVLEDDRLETMVIALREGRTIFNNIRKSLHFLLSTNFSEIMVMLLASAAGLGMPFNAMQLLWINLLSDIFPGLALALDPAEPDVMNRPPRDAKEPIIKGADFKRIALESSLLSTGALGAYLYGIGKYGRGPGAGTLAFHSLVTSQIVHALSCRSEVSRFFHTESLSPNHYLHLAIGGTLILQMACAFIPALRRLLGVIPLTARECTVLAATSLLPVLVNEITKPPTRKEIS